MKYMDTGNPVHVDTKLKTDGQSGRLIAHFVRQSNASYHDIDMRNKSTGGGNDGGGSKQSGGGGNGGGGNGGMP